MTIDLNRRLHDTRKPGSETPAERDRRIRAQRMAHRGAGFTQRHARDFLTDADRSVCRTNPNGTTLSDLVSIKQGDPEIAARFRRMDRLHPAVQGIRDMSLSLPDLEILDAVYRRQLSVGGEPVVVSRGEIAEACGLTPDAAEASLHRLIGSGIVTRTPGFTTRPRYKVQL